MEADARARPLISPDSDRQGAHRDYVKAECSEQTNEVHEDSVVPPADARSEPHAVVVKVEHTVVANVTVGCALGPEDHARLTELESVELRGMTAGVEVTHVEVVDALSLADYRLVSLMNPAYRLLIEELWQFNSARLTLAGMMPGSMLEVQSMSADTAACNMTLTISGPGF